MTVEQVLTSWRVLEKLTIEMDQAIADYTRQKPDTPKQVIQSFAKAEKLKLEDIFQYETEFDVSDLKAAIDKHNLKDDDRMKAISAEEYKKHAEKFQAKTAELLGKITQIEQALKKE